MSKNNIKYSLVGFDVPLIAEFDEYRNCINEPRVVIFRNIETVDGEFIQKYLVIHKIND